MQTEEEEEEGEEEGRGQGGRGRDSRYRARSGGAVATSAGQASRIAGVAAHAPPLACRVHGCTWCVEIGHPASRCEGPRLSETEVQMTLVEPNSWDKAPMKDWRTARNLDIFIELSRDPDGRFRKP